MNTLINGSKHNQPPRAPGTPDGCPTIGLLCDPLTNAVTVAMWNGVHDAARQLGANLLYFGGGFLQNPRLPQANAIYDLVTPETVDVPVVWGAQLTHYASQEELEAFCSQYHPPPIVNIGLAMEGIPSLLPDNHQGMRDVVAHPIEVHGCRRIALIRGNEGHTEDNMRYQGYIEALIARQNGKQGENLGY